MTLASTHTITGLPALLIILVVLVLLVLGVVALVRGTARGAKRVVHGSDDES